VRPRYALFVLVPLVLSACGGGEEDSGEPAPAAKEPAQPAVVQAFLREGWEETDFSKRLVPLDEFLSGGPPKDGIPAIDEPRFVSVREANEFLEPKEPVIELVLEGEARAYPIQILIWHEIANDEVAGVPVAVTFCPLCNTAIVFDRRVDGEATTFGTTGKLRHSDLVMYDRATESWWQQFGGKALVGKLAGTKLEQLPARMVAWGDFSRRHPDGRVLSRNTGHSRPYGQNPYAGYDDVDSGPLFPVPGADDSRLPPKERVVYLESGKDAVAVPFSALQREKEIRVEVGGAEFLVRWQAGTSSSLDADSVAGGRDVGSVEVLREGKPAEFSEPFWFTVAAFRPDVRIVRG
jgi:hypothetical protein